MPKREQANPQDELVSEHLVSVAAPYKVSYATYREGTDPDDLELAQSSWVSKTLLVLNSDQILARPDLAVVAHEGSPTPLLHVALHRRQGYVSANDSYAWDVWYTHDNTYHHIYLPALLLGASNR